MTNTSSLLPKLIRLNWEYFYLLKKKVGKGQQDGCERKEKKKEKKKRSQRKSFSHGYFWIFNYAS